jgi:hypothetical protein
VNPLSNVSLCGTEAGYKRHKRAAQPACDACKTGHASYVRDWYWRRGYRSHKHYTEDKKASE